MRFKLKKDNRNKLWAELEVDIQKQGKKKDKNFILRGAWKKFVKKQDGFNIYAVHGEWVRNNLSILFGHGGHGYVHEFIPNSEIWVVTHHFKECGCHGVRKDKKISHRFFNSTALHEITEFQEMRRGEIFWKAHQLALQQETKAAILKDPYTEEY